ncbi:MAG: LysM peptidoglycan-binding domain-containing protein [Desulfobacteraceae bacterium]|nr:LysM peptidoglycan-binding domain-containing protein [Desulfobacteraceae bacterium]
MYQMKWITNITGIIIFSILGFFPMTLAQEPNELEPAKKTGFYYTIQKGDTLWDLSQKFYNSQWDWPGLWEMNKDIKNPHQITPGTKIQIFLKSKTLPKAPPVQPPPEPVKVETPPISPSFTYQNINRTGFIRKHVVDTLGVIIRERDGNLMMSANDIIYIKPTNKANLIPGEIYQIFSTEKIEKKVNNQIFKGIKHLIKAEIKVLEHTDNYATAIITDSYRDANVNDKIMAYYKRDMVLSVQEHPPPINAFLICSEENTVIINQYQIAFIDKGRHDDIKPGQIYSIMQKNRSAFDATSSNWPIKEQYDTLLAPLNSGKLIVLHTEDIAATVMILSAKRALYPDDMVN